mmetsp:Transcript_8322/g.17790  ORF Transcript_8322/g.17790 Transcript_8322/m.17790 type:complete len:213 (-) Transcript_8322:1918-2556(-)
MPLLCLTVGLTAAVQQPCQVAPAPCIDEQGRCQLHDVVVGLPILPRRVHTPLQLLVINHLTRILNDEGSLLHILLHTHAVAPVLRQERLHARHLEQVEGLVAAELAAWTRAVVAVDEGQAVEAALSTALGGNRVPACVQGHSLTGAHRDVILVQASWAPLGHPDVALDVLKAWRPGHEPVLRGTEDLWHVRKQRLLHGPDKVADTMMVLERH